jgi:hypothetical protein
VRAWRVAIASLGIVGYACSLTHDVDEHSSLPACAPKSCVDFIGRCGKFTDPCSGVSETCLCPVADEQDCTPAAPSSDSGASVVDAGSDAASDAGDATVPSAASEPPGYCQCRGPIGCPLHTTKIRRAGDGNKLGAAGKEWSKLDGIVAGSAGCAEVTLPSGTQSDYLVATDFGFASEIPSGACIRGISVFIRRSADRAGVRDEAIRLIVDGALKGSTLAHTDENWKTTEEPRLYGGCTVTWGDCWNDVVTQPGFGVAIRVRHTGSGEAVARVCRVEMEVYFTAPEECSASCPNPCPP